MPRLVCDCILSVTHPPRRHLRLIMIDPRKTRFWTDCRRLGILDEAALQECYDAIEEEKRDDLIALERRMARKGAELGHLTSWQAQQIFSGRGDSLRSDKYVLLDRLGKGGMGRVFLARDMRLGRKVAIKMLTSERVQNSRAVSRFEREVMATAQLEHENLVRLYDGGQSAQGAPYLVMEFIEGPSSGQVIQERGRLEPGLAADLCRQVALGLEHARSKGMIHRDVHPWNILVTPRGVAKLTDLGLVISQRELAAEPVTRDGVTVGNFDYLSPEQARDSHDVDTRSDIYSLGCTLYHMLAGRVPFPTDSLGQKIFAHQAHEPDPLPADIPEGLRQVVTRMMRKNRDERFATPQDTADALEPFSEPARVGLAGIPAGGYRPPSPSTIPTLVTATPPMPGPLPAQGRGSATATAIASASGTSSSPTLAPPLNPTPNPFSTSGSEEVLTPSGFALRIDDDPDPPKKQKSSKSRIQAPPAPISAEPGPNWGAMVIWGVSALIFLGALGGAAFLMIRNHQGTTAPEKKGDRIAKSAPATGKPKAESAPAPAATSAASPLQMTLSGKTFPVADLQEFFERADGKKAILLLPEGGTTFETPDSIIVFDGDLTIRPTGEGRSAVTFKLPGNQPFLICYPKATLTLERLDITVESPEGSTAPLAKYFNVVELKDSKIDAPGRAPESLLVKTE